MTHGLLSKPDDLTIFFFSKTKLISFVHKHEFSRDFFQMQADFVSLF